MLCTCGCEILLQWQALSKCCLLSEAQNVPLYLPPPRGSDWVELWHFCCAATEESLYNPNCVLLLSASLFTELLAAGDDVPSSEWSMQAPKSPKCYNYHAQYYLWSISITVCCLAVLLIYYEGVQCPKLRSLWSTLATFAGRGTGIHIWEEFLPPPRQQREKSLLTQGNYREYECCVDTEWAHTFTWQ